MQLRTGLANPAWPQSTHEQADHIEGWAGLKLGAKPFTLAEVAVDPLFSRRPSSEPAGCVPPEGEPALI